MKIIVVGAMDMNPATARNESMKNKNRTITNQR